MPPILKSEQMWEEERKAEQTHQHGVCDPAAQVPAAPGRAQEKERQEELRRPQGSLPCAVSMLSLQVLLFLPPHPAAARTRWEHRTNPSKYLPKKGLPPLSLPCPPGTLHFSLPD